MALWTVVWISAAEGGNGGLTQRRGGAEAQSAPAGVETSNFKIQTSEKFQGSTFKLQVPGRVKRDTRDRGGGQMGDAAAGFWRGSRGAGRLLQSLSEN